MALGLPNSIKLMNAPSKRVLIASSAVACLVITATITSFTNNSMYEDTSNEITEASDKIEYFDGTILGANSKNEGWDETVSDKGKEVTKNISVLKPYPLEIQSASQDLANLRNPFAPPTSFGSAQGIPAPLISIKGFAANKNDPRVFLNIDNSEDFEYKIGQTVGSGYRIVEINSINQLIIVSDGISRFKYILKEY